MRFFSILCILLLSGCAMFEKEKPQEGFVRIFNWSSPTNEVNAEKYRRAGVTDIIVRSKKQLDLALKYQMTPYYGCFTPTGPHPQEMTPEEQAAHNYINGLDLPSGMPVKERRALINQRRKEKDHRFGGETPYPLDTINRKSLSCFISDKDYKLSKAKLDKILDKAPEGAAGIFFDYFGYTNHRGCYCANCRELCQEFLRRNNLQDSASNRGIFYRDQLVKYYNAMVDHVKSRKPGFKVVAHFYPDFQFEPFFGNRTNVDFAGHTVAWYFKAPLELVAANTKKVLAEEKLYYQHQVSIPFLGLSTAPESALGYKTPAEVEKELLTILAAGGKMLMVCNGSAMIEPGYFEVFSKFAK